jgi:DNA-binding NarL/FixJ family response regulator
MYGVYVARDFAALRSEVGPGVGSVEPERSVIGRESVREPVGTVWICCPYPVVAAGLSDALGGVFGVHLGLSAPAGGVVPVCAIFDTGGVENLSEGIRLIHEVSSEIPILVFGLHLDLPLARAALRLGARGFIHAGMELDQIARATQVAAGGEIVVPRKILEHLVTDEEPADLDALTARQREILELVARGHSNAQIAKDLFLSESTVKQHLRATYKVLGVSDRKEAARLINAR